jgi:arylsulfatase A-like enzyme
MSLTPTGETVRRCIAAAALLGLLAGLTLGGILALARGGVVEGSGPRLLLVAHTAALFMLAASLAGLVPALIAGLVAGRRRGAAGRPAGELAPALVLGLIAALWTQAWWYRMISSPWSWAIGLAAGALLAGLGLLSRRWTRPLERWTYPALAVAGALVLVVALAVGSGSPTPLDRASEPPAVQEAGLTPPPDPEVPIPRPANLLLIVVDTLRADHLSCYGYQRRTSPRIDRFAAEGTRFVDAIVQKPKTSPSMASILTGTYPHTHGLIDCKSWLPDEALTLPEILAERGWQTAAVVSNANLSPTFNFDQGFETHVHIDKKAGGHEATRVNAVALEWLEENHERPFFLYVHYMEPHARYSPPPPYRDRFVGDELWGEHRGLRPPIGRDRLGTIHRRDAIEGGSRDLDLYVARYDGEIASVDEQIGRLLDRLRELGLEDTTLVAFTSDHGESLTEHAVYFDHGQFAYENNLRVPLILRYPPAIPVGHVEETVVQSIDLAPTLLDLLGVPPPREIEGRSLLPLMLGGAPARPGVAYAEAGYVKGKLITAIRTREWKLIFNPRGAHPASDAFHPAVLLHPLRLKTLWRAAHGGPGSWRRWELFHLPSDPDEETDLASERPEVLAELQARLEGWLATAPAERNPVHMKKEKLPPDILEELRALGYVE